MVKDVYCGMNPKVPTGKKRGTFEECLQSRQVRYYGIEGVKERMKQAREMQKEVQNIRNIFVELRRRKAGLVGQISNLSKSAQYKRNLDEKTAIEQQIKLLNKNLKEINEVMAAYREKFGSVLNGL